jgi:hypothetical protein
VVRDSRSRTGREHYPSEGRAVQPAPGGEDH